MSTSRLETRAEIAKLARLLDVAPESLTYLERLGAADLRVLRERATDRLYDGDAGGMQRVAAASAVIPASVSATIAHRALGPLLCARVAGALDTKRAVDIATRLPPQFLADVAVLMDPRRASSVIAAIPTSDIVPVAKELAQRGEHITMGRFVGHLSDVTLSAVFAVLGDEDLLPIAFTLEDKDRLDHLTQLLAPERISGILRTAAEQDLWAEALDLMNHLSPERRALFAAAAAELPDDVLDTLFQAAEDEDLWPELEALAATIEDPALVERLGGRAGRPTPTRGVPE